MRSHAETSSQAQFLQHQSLWLLASIKPDEPKEHRSTNRSEWIISQFSVPSMLLEEQIQKEQRCTDASLHQFLAFSFNLTIFIPVEVTKQLHNNLTSSIAPPI
jgi:hypothetical protein